MLRHTEYTQERIRQVVRRIHEKVYADRVPAADLSVAGPTQRISYAQAQELREFSPAAVGDRFGPAWATHWFRAKFKVPQAWKSGRVDLIWDSQSRPLSGSTERAFRV